MLWYNSLLQCHALLQLLVVQLQPGRLRALQQQQLVQILWAAAVLGISQPVLSEDTVRKIVEVLHGGVPLMSCRTLARVLHALALLRMRPYRAWRYDWEQQFLRRYSGFDREDTVAVLFSLAALHPSPEVKLGAPLTTALLACMERHMPAMGSVELVTVKEGLHALHRKLNSRQLRSVDAELSRRLQHMAC